jgi:hypothetical protein
MEPQMILDPYAVHIIFLLMVIEDIITFDQYEAMIARFRKFLPGTMLSTIAEDLLTEAKARRK